MTTIETGIKVEKRIARGKSLIDRHSVIFFDVFDTLIARDCAEPADVFDIVERRYNCSGETICNFRKLRIEAERSCAEAIFAARLDEIYDFLPVHNKKLLKTIEIDTEKKLCTKKYIGYKLYCYAKAQGKRIAAVSDMYLSSCTVREILASAGYEIDTVIVSCEYRVEKYNGGLFREALKQMTANSKDTVHFGDKLVSDYLGATSVGIEAMLIFGQPSMSYLKKCDDPFADRYLLPFIANRIPLIENKVEALGYEILGPIIVGFCQWVHEKLQEGGYQKALFCARDMKQTLEIYLQMYPEDEELVRYFYISVKSLQSCCLALKGKETSSQPELLREYLRQLNCSGKVALVDSGINGRSQRMLTHIIAGCFDLHGLYMRTSKFFRNNVLDPESCAYLTGDNPDIRFFISSAFFEALITTSHGRTLGWTKGDDHKIVPILGVRNNNSETVEAFQRGAQLFAHDYLESCFFKQYVIRRESICNAFLRFAFYPERKDVTLMKDLSGGNAHYISCIAQKEKTNMLVGLKESYWKGGYLCHRLPYFYKPLSWLYQLIDCWYLNHFSYRGLWDPE